MFQDLAGLMQRVRFEIWDEADVDVIVRVPVTEIIRLPPPPPPPSERSASPQFTRDLMGAAREQFTRDLMRAAREQFFGVQRDMRVREARAAREAMEDATPRWQRTV
jgi:hypothetical protein